MRYIKPDYYDAFACTADQCEDTCCAGWQIVIDEDALNRYKKEKGPYRKELHKRINWRKKIFRQDASKRCAFLREDNFCQMYRSLGEESLCKTCTMYPRHVEEFEGVRETSLSISCPEVAKYLMARTSPVEFHTVETEEEETCTDFEEMDFDLLLYDVLDESRNCMLRILQDRSRSMIDRCEAVLHLAAEVESAIEEGNMFGCQDIMDACENGTASYQKRRLKKAMEYSKRVLNGLFRLERLRDDWEMLLTESAALLYLEGETAYDQTTRNYHQWLTDNHMDLSIPYEQLAVYFVSTYYCGAVYNDRILSKVQSAVLSLFVVEELCKARWIRNEGALTSEDLYTIVYRFSRELEHSDENLETMERLAAAALPVQV